MGVGFGANVAWPGGGSKAPIPDLSVLAPDGPLRRVDGGYRMPGPLQVRYGKNTHPISRPVTSET
jgi:hypothetical protein